MCCCSYLTVEWRAKKHDLPPKLFDGMRASYPGVRKRERRGGWKGEREKVWPSCLMWLMSPGIASPLPQVQLQDNSSDCGVFVLQYVESLLKVSSTSVSYYHTKPSCIHMWHVAKLSLKFLSFLLQSVKENRPLPSSPDAWASYKETNSKRTVIKSLITDFEKRPPQESKPKAS